MSSVQGDRKKPRRFPEDFKREAVERVRSSGLTVRAVAQELGIHETVLCRWKRAYEASGTEAVGPIRQPTPSASPADLAAENNRLRRELETTKTERDILTEEGKKTLRGSVFPTKAAFGISLDPMAFDTSLFGQSNR